MTLSDLAWIVGFPTYLTVGTLAAIYLPHYLRSP